MHNIIILSSCSWSEMLQRPHLIAKELSNRGNDVHFIDPQFMSISEAVDCEQETMKRKTKIGNLNVYSPVRNAVSAANLQRLVLSLCRPKPEENIVIAYFPWQIEYLLDIKANFRLVYDCVDEHRDLAYSYWSSKRDLFYEDLLLREADLVLTTSSALFLSRFTRAKKIGLVKNGVDMADFFSGSPAEPEDLQHIPAPRIAYVGAVDSWFATDLFSRLVRENADKSFVVIGPVREGVLDLNYPNLYLLGVKDHARLKDYLHYMHVGIIPFKDEIELTISCNPIKMYEYVAAGLPVVSTGLPETYVGEDFVVPCHSYANFNKYVNLLLNTKIDEGRRRDFVQQNTWKKRVDEIVNFIEDQSAIPSTHQMLQNMRVLWSEHLGEEDNPALFALYGLTYVQEDPKTFLAYTARAYMQENTSFTLKNYLHALLLCGEIHTAVEVLMKDKQVDEVIKAELEFYKDIGSTVLFEFLIRKQAGQLTEESLAGKTAGEEKYQRMIYSYEVGDYDEALEQCISLQVESPAFTKSPLFQEIYSFLMNQVHNK